MPLSPMLANLLLARFDRGIEKNKIPMIRYADDLLLFFGTREEAKRGQKLVEDLLGRVGLKLSQAKTSVHGPGDNVTFLGLEIAFLEKQDKYVARVSRPQIRKIRDRLEEEYSFSKRANSSTLNDTVVCLSRSVAAYLGVYRSAFDYPVLHSELQRSMHLVLANLYIQTSLASMCSTGWMRHNEGS